MYKFLLKKHGSKLLTSTLYLRPIQTLNIPKYTKQKHLPINIPLIYKLQKRYHSPLSEALGEENERVTRIGVYSNIGLTLIKGFGGYLTNSMSLIADAIHSLSDLLSDFITFFTIRYSRSKPTINFPYGFGKIDTLGSLSVSGILIIASYHITKLSFIKLYTGTYITSSIIMPQFALICILSSLIIKEWLYRITIKAGNESNSNVTKVNAWHHRSDALTSFVALIGVGGSFIGYPIADPLCGFLVGVYLFRMSSQFIKSGIYELLDHSTNEKYNEIKNIIQNINGVINVDELILKKSGVYFHVVTRIKVNDQLNMKEVQLIVDKVKLTLQEKHELHIQHLIVVPQIINYEF